MAGKRVLYQHELYCNVAAGQGRLPVVMFLIEISNDKNLLLARQVRVLAWVFVHFSHFTIISAILSI
jgi:hypothetical protein